MILPQQMIIFTDFDDYYVKFRITENYYLDLIVFLNDIWLWATLIVVQLIPSNFEAQNNNSFIIMKIKTEYSLITKFVCTTPLMGGKWAEFAKTSIS